MKKRFELFDHTADIGLRVYGGTPAELFTNAAQGMFSIIVKQEEVRNKEERSVKIDGGDYGDLLVSWLSELLYQFDTEGKLWSEFEISDINERRLQAVLRGEQVDPKRHELKTEIKAVTYHGLRVQNTADGWVAEIIFDI